MFEHQIKEMLTVEQWAMWKRHMKRNNVVFKDGFVDNYEFHEFYKTLGIVERQDESSSEGRSSIKGDKPLVPTDSPEGDGLGGEMDVHPYDHVPQRREAHDEQPPLQEPSNGPENVRPAEGESPRIHGPTKEQLGG